MNKVVTTKQAAAILRTSTDTALRFLKSKGVEHDTIGKAYEWDLDDIIVLVPVFEDRRTRRKNAPPRSAAGLSAVQQETRRQALGAMIHKCTICDRLTARPNLVGACPACRKN